MINRNSVTIRIIIITFLTLIFLIPSGMISSLISERSARKEEAVAEITSKWAGVQTIGGPILTVPYEIVYKDDKGKISTGLKHLHFLPETLAVDGKLTSFTRYRGIYRAALYNAELNSTGKFSFAKLNSLNVIANNIKWKDAFLEVQITAMRGIKDAVSVVWNDAEIPFEPGIREGGIFNSGVSVKLPVTPAEAYQFFLKLNLNGSEEFNLLPLGRITSVRLVSPWTDPSFVGAFLPESRSITHRGFSAQWKILNLNRNYPQQWLGNDHTEAIRRSAFGVQMFSPVDQYTQIARALKYILMFVALTFLVFFLIEVFSKKRIHPVQYLLIGFALSIFYVLLLSLAEHIGFILAYLIASGSIICLICLYVRSALNGDRSALLTGLLLAGLYTYLYILLENQDYALLIGSAGLFAILAGVMYYSRKIDWYQLELSRADLTETKPVTENHTSESVSS